MSETRVIYPMPWLQIVLPLLLTLAGLALGGLLEARDRKLGASPPAGIRSVIARLVAVASALVIVTLFVVLFLFNPYSDPTYPMATFARMSHVLLSAGLAAVGGILGKRSWLVCAFAIGFFPQWIGLYLLGVPGIFHWIPVAQFGFLVAAWLLGRAQSYTTSTAEAP